MRLQRLQGSFLANATAVVVVAFAQLLFTPLYVRILGVESYGLVGLFVVLQPVLQLLDLGISSAVNREVAQRSASGEAHSLPDLVRTLEVLYWPIGIALAAAVWLGADRIAALWGEAALPPEIIRSSIRKMGLLIGLQWPIAFYQAVLRGLQRQVGFNVLKTLTVLGGSGGAALVLLYVSPTVPAFFVTHAVVGAIHVVLVGALCWRNVPGRARVRPAIVRGVLRYGMFVMLTNMLAVAITHLDKLAVTRLLPLSDLGIYTIAALIPMGLLVVTVPIFNTVFPAMSSLVAAGDESSLRRLYLDAAQFTCVLLFPPAMVVVLFSREVLWTWLADASIAAAAGPVVALLVTGSVFAALMETPYMVQLAYGHPSIALRFSASQLVIYLPTVYFMTREFGVVGAAFAWPLVNALYVAVGVPLTHALFLRGASREWLWSSFGRPFAASLGVALIARVLMPDGLSRGATLVWLVAIALLALAAATASAPALRVLVARRAAMRIAAEESGEQSSDGIERH